MADLLHLVDKPEGWTSHDAVARMRTILGESRVGHAGTLDPFATGLLLVGEGRSTGFLACLGLLPKRYLARARLGVTTDTQDRTGTVTRTSDATPTPVEIESEMARFRGRIRQRPPLYSAIKVRGEPLYRAARRGEDVERSDREVHVYDFRLVSAAELPVIHLDVTVSRGTYVRTLAHDLGEALGCGAHLTELRRVASGPFRVEDALSPARDSGHDAEAFRARAFTPERALSFLPRVRLDDAEAAGLRHGRAPVLTPSRVEPTDGCWPLPPGEQGWPLALLSPSGQALAVAQPRESQIPGEPVGLLRVLVGS
jgi:tRNA pseudouridine55 synthase